MSTINPFPLNITLKVNSPMLLAYLAQYGEDKFVSAEDFNKIFQALDYLHENLDPSGNDFNPSEHDLEEFLNEGADPFAHQSEIPGPQNFQSVTDGAGNNETTNSIKVGGFEIKDKLAFITSALTALRNINWPDKDGTVALLSDLTAIQEGIAWKQPAELLLQYADVVQGGGLPRIPGLTIQGHTLAQGSRVVVTGYNIPYQNGIFRVGSGPTIGTGEYSLSRVADANTSAELNNAVIGITNGNFAGKTYRQTTVNPVINTSPISFVEFGNSTVANATNVLAGIAKLYNAIGNEIDGGITPKAVKDGLELKQDNLTDVNFGAFSNGLTAKTTIVDADLVNIVDSADSNKSKKVTWLNIFTNYIKAKTDLLYRAYLEQFATIITSLPDTITLAQMNSWVRINVATDGNLTIPPNSSVPIPVGAYYYIRQSGVGRITLVAGAGVTLNSPENVLTTGSQYSVIKITKQATDNWMVEIGSSSFYNSFILPLLNNKVDKTSWVDYSATSTIVGFSSFATKVIRYKQLSDNVIWVKGQLIGTSNSGLINFTIPFTSANTSYNIGNAIASNTGNVVTSAVVCSNNANSNVVNIYRDNAGTAFTNSGVKGGIFSILIEI